MATTAESARVQRRIAIISQLDPQDARYPRPGWFAGLRWVSRLWFVPVTAYLGNLAMNALMFAVRAGFGGISLNALGTHLTGTDAIAALLSRAPLLALAGIAGIALLTLLGRQVSRDARREAMVLRLREMWRVVERRQRRAEAAQTLRIEAAGLRQEIHELLALVPAAASVTGPGATDRGATVRQRVAILAAQTDELARDLDAQAMVEALAEQQMRAWEREQRAFMTAVSTATVLAGFLVPLFSSAAPRG